MTDHLDSRALRNTDSYGQRFMRPGTYRYALGPAGTGGFLQEYPYVISVGEGEPKRGEMAQTTVLVRREGRTYVPDQPKISINAGDMVMWHSPEAAARPFVVAGEKDFFSSERLVNESGYTHAFTSEGVYEWEDAHGSGTRGLIRVGNPDVSSAKGQRAWARAQRKGTVVMVTDGQAEPAEVDVVVGQTVFFAVVNGPGISITDRSLLAHDGHRKGAAFHRNATRTT
ncbi:hypothetical protein [Intrasporangium sp. DVR]|uniref:hypothetical protein n=1 Tax=Intrasporangium sp. DVR TaxID=3127867 RepID=UPI00313A55D2